MRTVDTLLEYTSLNGQLKVGALVLLLCALPRKINQRRDNFETKVPLLLHLEKCSGA